jgi:hypothetical protein
MITKNDLVGESFKSITDVSADEHYKMFKEDPSKLPKSLFDYYQLREDVIQSIHDLRQKTNDYVAQNFDPL